MDACTNPDILRVIYFFLLIINIVKIIIPIALIVLGIIDFSKSVMTSDEKVQKKTISLFFKRLLYAVLVFAVPWIIKVLMVTLGNLSVTDEINFTDCLENANSECIDALDGNNLTIINEKCDVPENYQTEGSGNTVETVTEACYYCPVTNTYLWRPGVPSENCPGGIQWTKKEDIAENNCEIKNESGACYYCPVTNTYLWRPGVPSENCPGGIQWTKKEDITKNNCN